MKYSFGFKLPQRVHNAIGSQFSVNQCMDSQWLQHTPVWVSRVYKKKENLQNEIFNTKLIQEIWKRKNIIERWRDTLKFT